MKKTIYWIISIAIYIVLALWLIAEVKWIWALLFICMGSVSYFYINVYVFSVFFDKQERSQHET